MDVNQSGTLAEAPSVPPIKVLTDGDTLQEPDLELYKVDGETGDF